MVNSGKVTGDLNTLKIVNDMKITYVEPLIHVVYLSALDYVLTGSGNAPTIEEDPDAGFPDY